MHEADAALREAVELHAIAVDGDELAAYAVARGYARKLVVAGVFEPEHGALVDFERSDWDFTMNLDLTSIFTMCKKVGGYTAV